MTRNLQPTYPDGTPHHWRCTCQDCIRYDEWVSERGERRKEATAEEGAYLAERAYERQLEGI